MGIFMPSFAVLVTGTSHQAFKRSKKKLLAYVGILDSTIYRIYNSTLMFSL